MESFKQLKSSKMHVAWIAGATLAATLCLSGATQAAPDTALHAVWRAAITSTPLPGSGCFAAHFPSKTWTQVACAPAPTRLYRPAGGGSGGFTVGNGHDYAAEVTSLIKTGLGSFPKITGLTSETNDGSSNTYSLQLNSQFFSSPACSGGGQSCFGWQQFIYAQPDCSGPCVFMQSWLINYGSHCPSGWNYAGDDDCYYNSNATGVPTQSLSNLKDLQLSGTVVSGGNETVKLTTSNDAYSASEPDSVVGLSGYWDATEYNIFGDGGGSQADFNSGTSIKVKIQLQDGSTAAPTCESNAGTTGETNNLNLGACKTKGGKKPSIMFTESN